MADPAPSNEYSLEKIRAAHRRAMVVTAAIAATLPLYVVIVEVLRRTQPAVTPMAGIGVLRITFFALAGVFIFTATVAKAMFLRSASADPDARLARLRVAAVMTAAFAEAPAVLGLALFIISLQRSDFYILLVVALYLLVRHFPQREAWELFVRRGGDAR